MAHPTTRVLAVLELLQTHGRMSGAELARRLEVDGRTLRRYISALEDLGIPITSERGRYGAYMLVAGFKLPPMMFNEDEALALSVGLLAARSLGLAEANAAVTSAQAKLERVMPANLKQRLRAVDETVGLDLSSSPAPGSNQALTVLSAAAQQGRRVHMRYRSSKGEGSERDFDPYGLLYRKGCWYVGGHCHLRQGLRSFRLDRMEVVTMLETHFTRPADFDAAAHLDFSIATLPRQTPVEVLLKTDLKTAMLELGEHIGLFEPHPEGVLFKTSTDGIGWMARQLARLSFGFEIRVPGELREALRGHARSLLGQPWDRVYHPGQSWEAVMDKDVILKRFEHPDETRVLKKGRFEIVRLGGMTIGRATYEPGWRWSEHVGRELGQERCGVEHVGLVLSGTATAAFADGRVIELKAGNLFYIPPEPHDSWVVGDEPYVSLHFMGADKYAAK